MAEAPYRNQKLWWLVPGKFAIGIGKNDMVEIFTAKPDPRFACGYRFQFMWTYFSIQGMKEALPMKSGKLPGSTWKIGSGPS